VVRAKRWVRALTVNAKVATILVPNPATSQWKLRGGDEAVLKRKNPKTPLWNS
jgi:hypothetical protein